MARIPGPKNRPTGPPTVFPVEDYRVDLIYLFQHLDASTSGILEALAESIYLEHLGKYDDLKVVAILELAEKVKKLEQAEESTDV